MERLQVLSQADASSACTSWVRQLAKDILKHCPAPMAACASPADFAALEAHLQAAISQWHPPRQPATQGTCSFGWPCGMAVHGHNLFHVSVGNPSGGTSV